jgi:hypothetical protein
MERQFPVLWQGDRKYMKALADAECPRSVPWDFVALHAEWCLRNHDQTPDRLAERGGLSPEEILAVTRNTRLSVASVLDYFHDPALAVRMLKDAVMAWESTK